MSWHSRAFPVRRPTRFRTDHIGAHRSESPRASRGDLDGASTRPVGSTVGKWRGSLWVNLVRHGSRHLDLVPIRRLCYSEVAHRVEHTIDWHLLNRE